jgi:hypothetical protein
MDRGRQPGGTPPPPRPSGPEAEALLARARTLARLLDDSIPIPGTGWRIGIDPLLGLVPGLGDLLGSLLSLWLLVLGARLGAPPAVLARMAVNVGVEALVGAVPVAGDLFDAGFKANVRNLRLLEAWRGEPVPTRRASRAAVAAIVLATLLVLAAVLFALWSLLSWALGAR